MSSQRVAEGVQYIVSESGERTGVLLSWETYAALRGRNGGDPDLMDELSDQELRALSEGMLAPAYQTRLDDLLHRNKAGRLGEEETGELDDLLGQVDALNILKARAQYTLRSRSAAPA
jgi:hypothetical protein